MNDKPVAVQHADTITHLVVCGFELVGTADVSGKPYGLFKADPRISDSIRAFERIVKIVREWTRAVKRGNQTAYLPIAELNQAARAAA